ncbi:hypothetical protein [Dyadobacter alkalitolerans]|uniref:hypothetical protein n=1 Tax=Dyadobacter alkalitolerans TaxID=492736 RepID=UPI0003FE5D2F|nr:hypothetical protein [Dyadobacter alkalitolerans]
MKTQNLLFNISWTKITSVLFVAALLLGSSAVFAQVKIGTNPATIEPNSNLEVEASTPGRKTKIDKTTGQVTITDGTEGAGKVLTSDAAGGASWQNPLAGTMINGTTGEIVNFSTGAIEQKYSGGSITLPKAGTYMVYARWATYTAATTHPIPNHAFINTALSSSASTYVQEGIAAEWLFVVPTAHHTTPGFRVTVAGPQTLYFWFYTGYYTGDIQFQETYAIGPF